MSELMLFRKLTVTDEEVFEKKWETVKRDWTQTDRAPAATSTEETLTSTNGTPQTGEAAIDDAEGTKQTGDGKDGKASTKATSKAKAKTKNKGKSTSKTDGHVPKVEGDDNTIDMGKTYQD